MTKREDRVGFWGLLAQVCRSGWPATLRLAFLLMVCGGLVAASRLLG